MNEYADTGIFLLLPLYNLHYSSVQFFSVKLYITDSITQLK